MLKRLNYVGVYAVLESLCKDLSDDVGIIREFSLVDPKT